ncbi:MAG: glutaredoxin family protein [Desulfobulbaceae bacterium]|nr:glutaredoxin family protein [Desulfobulbaceae bacterium]
MPIEPVQIFTISTCIHCKALKKMLDEHKIPYEFTDIDLMPKEERDSFIAAIIQYNEKKTFPVVMIGNKAIVGFQEQVIRKELGI